MPLSRLLGIANFCFNSLSLFLSIVSILSSQAISLQILLYALFPPFPWSTLFPFPSYFKLYDLTYLGIDVSTDDLSMQQQTALKYIFDLHNIHAIPKNISRDPINRSPPTHPDHRRLYTT